MGKDFDQWNGLKKQLNAEVTLPRFSERDIWWGCVGVNIGHEQDGKNAEFSRPVLVVKKFNRRLFWGVPLTTQIKDNRHYHPFTFKGRDQCALLTQLRLWDANRLTGRMGHLGLKEFDAIKRNLAAYLQ
ncbi:MAG: type II toxin-antitoxin system PemK/MazF family toxin [Verrucomicrobiota bacterium]